MSMFKNFNSKQSKNSLTPELIFKVSIALTLFVNSDYVEAQKNGETNFNAVQPLVTPFLRFSDDQQEIISIIFEDAVTYIYENEIFSNFSFNIDALTAFLGNAASVLNQEQKLAILINVGDLLLSDGIAEEDEQELFSMFLDGFGISEKDFQPYLQTIMLKHDRSLF